MNTWEFEPTIFLSMLSTWSGDGVNAFNKTWVTYDIWSSLWPKGEIGSKAASFNTDRFSVKIINRWLVFFFKILQSLLISYSRIFRKMFWLFVNWQSELSSFYVLGEELWCSLVALAGNFPTSSFLKMDTHKIRALA